MAATPTTSAKTGVRVGTVAAITRYPVKSMQGEALPSATLGPLGIDGDRQWGIVDLDSGHVLTGKRTGQLLDASAHTADGGPVVDLPDASSLTPGAEADAALSDWLD